jgi:hypothetical protein
MSSLKRKEKATTKKWTAMEVRRRNFQKEQEKENETSPLLKLDHNLQM